jgi:hypothetical protein
MSPKRVDDILGDVFWLASANNSITASCISISSFGASLEIQPPFSSNIRLNRTPLKRGAGPSSLHTTLEGPTE